MFPLSVMLAAAFHVLASEPTIWTVNTRTEVMKGDVRGVSVDENGVIRPAPALKEVFDTGESYIWASTATRGGELIVGTGPQGKIFRISNGGKGEMLADLEEMNVTAVAAAADGTIFAATAPDGKVYRIGPDKRPTVYFDPKEKYIWALQLMADGSLIAATGDNGKIYRVTAAGADPQNSVLFDSADTHVISLAVDAAGNLYAGTDPGGVVIRFGRDRKPFALLDSPLREIHAIAPAADGSVYVLAIGDSTSAPAASPSATPSATPEQKPIAVKKRAAATPEPAPKSRYDLGGVRSAVYRMTAAGEDSLIWTSPSVTAFSLLAEPTGVLVGTADKGRVYRVRNDGGETLLTQSDAGQISTLAAGGNGIWAAASNRGKVYQLERADAAEGIYTSSVLDAGTTALWGRLWWRATGDVVLETRSGNTERADGTWSEWSAVAGRDSGKAQSPRARYFQWRARLKGGDAAVSEVSLAFTGRNIAPEVLAITLLPPNVALLPNPPVQIDPNIELSGLEPSAFGITVVTPAPRRAYQRAAAALQWIGEDRNGDEITYDLFYKRVNEREFKRLASGLKQTFFTIDGLSLPAGRYVVKVVAKDEGGRTGERQSVPFDIDTDPPVVTVSGSPQISSGRAKIRFDAADASSYLVRAEYSINGGEWRAVDAEDGISDSPHERYEIDHELNGSGEYAISIRVFDAVGNIGTASVTVQR